MSVCFSLFVSGECTRLMGSDKSESGGSGGMECKVCLDQPVTIAFQPCGHVPCCEQCAELLEICPLCRAEIMEKNRIYL